MGGYAGANHRIPSVLQTGHLHMGHPSATGGYGRNHPAQAIGIPARLAEFEPGLKGFLFPILLLGRLAGVLLEDLCRKETLIEMQCFNDGHPHDLSLSRAEPLRVRSARAFLISSSCSCSEELTFRDSTSTRRAPSSEGMSPSAAAVIRTWS